MHHRWNVGDSHLRSLADDVIRRPVIGADTQLNAARIRSGFFSTAAIFRELAKLLRRLQKAVALGRRQFCEPNVSTFHPPDLSDRRQHVM
jgi:hypothetical protein